MPSSKHLALRFFALCHVTEPTRSLFFLSFGGGLCISRVRLCGGGEWRETASWKVFHSLRELAFLER